MQIDGLKILVTGGAGYVGSVLIPEFLKKGAHIRVLDNLMYGGKSMMPLFREKGFEFTRGDVRDEKTVADAMKGMDAVIHLAAIVGYPACKKDPVLAEDVNHKATVLVEKLREDRPIFYASTGSNYGALVGEMCTEETPLNPLTVYGTTKTAAEAHILNAGNCVCYRYATAFGVSNRMRLDLLINDFVFQAVKNRNLVVYEKSFKRTFIDVYDMARSFIFAFENFEKMQGNVYNVGSEKMNYSKEDIAEMVKKKFDFYLHFADFGKDEDQRNYEVSYKKIHDLGFDTTVTVEAGINQLINAYEALDLTHEFSNV